jgi:hypothetical protein
VSTSEISSGGASGLPQNNQPSNGIAPQNPTDLEFGADYVQARPHSYSTRVYQNLAGSVPLRSAIGRKPTAREQLIIAATVLSAADEHIEELERERRFMNRVSSLVNAPLFARAVIQGHVAVATGGGAPGNPSTPTGEGTQSETGWFQSYLTLRNILAAIVVVCSLIGGFLAFATQNYKDRMDGAEKRAEAADKAVGVLQTDVEYWKKQRDGYFEQLTKKEKELEDRSRDLQKVREQLGEAQKVVTARDATIQSLQQSLTKVQASLATATAAAASKPGP